MASAVLERWGNLPAEVTRFIGRRGELAEATRLLRSARLVTLAGVSGVGKSRLALKLAADLRADFPDGSWFVELSGLRDPDLLAHTVAEAMHLPDQAARDQLDVLADHLADKRLLLVLDTCEHLVDACAMLAEVLLRAAPQLCVLATSREALDVPGEHLLAVQPLSVPDPEDPVIAEFDAVTLFTDRATAVQPGFILADHRQAVARLCYRLDGIPLAIELAAGRLRALSVEQIVERLDDRFRLLGSARTSLTRHQTLHAAVDWSHELCTEDERTLWAKLSVFAGSFDLEAAEDVCGGDMFDPLTRLVEKSIVLREPDGGRYRMLDTIREYGVERLTDRDELRRRHRDWYLARVQKATDEALTARQAEWFDRLGRDHPNLRLALDYSLSTPGEALTGLRLAAALWSFWFTHGFFSEGRHWLDRALELCPEPTTTRVRALYIAGLLAVMQGDYAAAAPLQEEATELAGRLGDPAALAYTAQLAGMSALFAGDLDSAAARLTESVSRQRETGKEDVFSLVNLPLLAATSILRGEHEQGIAYSEECLRLTEPIGERWAYSYGLYTRALARGLGGDLSEGLRDARDALRIKQEIGDRMGMAMIVDLAGGYATAGGDHERAARLFGAGDRMWRTLGASMWGPGYTGIRDAHIRKSRKALGTESFEAGRRAGATMSVDEAVAYALGGDAGNGSGPLTRREAQIAGLIAEGLSNREIADKLVIAKRTVDSHVEHILAKLGVGSRAQVAAWTATRQN